MAYMSQERKAELAPAIKAVLKKYNVKGTIGVRHHSTLVIKLKKGDVNFGQIDSDFGARVNVYHIDSSYEGEAAEFLQALYQAAMVGNHDNSDIMTDYFDVGWYVDITIRGDYEHTGASEYFGGLPIVEEIEIGLPAEPVAEVA